MSMPALSMLVTPHLFTWFQPTNSCDDVTTDIAGYFTTATSLASEDGNRTRNPAAPGSPKKGSCLKAECFVFPLTIFLHDIIIIAHPFQCKKSQAQAQAQADSELNCVISQRKSAAQEGTER